jgi:hypothetical protein
MQVIMPRKKSIELLTTLVLLSVIVPAAFGQSIGTVSADVSGNFQYSLLNNGTAAQITGFLGGGASAAIPSVIGGVPVISISDGAFYNCTALT